MASKQLTKEEMIQMGILKPAPPAKPTKRVKVQSRKEKPVNMLPPRGISSFPAYYDD